MKVAIIKYNAGNIYSVKSALNRLDIEPLVTDDPQQLISADKVIFPGVGEARTAMAYLREKNLDKLFTELKQPVLGICLGLQLMCAFSEEKDTPCLEIFPTQVKIFPPTFKVPHMGWNALSGLKGPLFAGIEEGSYVYFVHSYYAELGDYTIASTSYAVRFAAAMQRNNFYALQFHTEKSADIGARILKNFIEL